MLLEKLRKTTSSSNSGGHDTVFTECTLSDVEVPHTQK